MLNHRNGPATRYLATPGSSLDSSIAQQTALRVAGERRLHGVPMTKVWGDLDADPKYLKRLEKEEAAAVAPHDAPVTEQDLCNCGRYPHEDWCYFLAECHNLVWGDRVVFDGLRVGTQVNYVNARAAQRLSRRWCVLAIVGASLLLWALAGALFLAMAAPAHAGYSCTRLFNTVYCNDDSSTRTVTCTTIGRTTYCN